MDDLAADTTQEKEFFKEGKLENEVLIRSSPDYDSYIAAKVTNEDIFYLENPIVARALLENWAACDKIPLEKKRFVVSREEFDRVKQRQKEHTSSYCSGSVQQHSALDMEGYRSSEFFSLFQERIQLIKERAIHSIVFIRMILNRKEVSGYIDLEDRISRKKRRKDMIVSGELFLQPQTSDLSFMDWSGCQIIVGGQLNNSRNFKVMTSGSNIKFRSEATGLVIDPNSEDPGIRTKRTVMTNPFPYMQVTFLDHTLEDSDSEEEGGGGQKRARARDRDTKSSSEKEPTTNYVVCSNGPDRDPATTTTYHYVRTKESSVVNSDN